MDTNVLLGIVIIIMLVFSAYFSATETAYSSLNKIRIKSCLLYTSSGLYQTKVKYM